MGFYLNSKKASLLYQDESKAAYFVDKTDILDDMVSLVEEKEGNKYICIARPRRFGKSVMASMIASYFGKGRDSRAVFDRLSVSSRSWYEKHLNKHNVIYIAFNEMPQNCNSYRQYIDRICQRMAEDLKTAYPDILIDENDAIWDILNGILEFETEDVRFVFVFDEWDYIFHQSFITTEDKVNYLRFLSNLLKGQPYVELVYMTGILPISKYSSGSELNMFYEYTMVTEKRFGEFFGFTETEVDTLFEKYLKSVEEPHLTREEIREWYDGYHIKHGERVYNPRSVVAALTNNNLGNYWTSAGPYDEIYYYINHNTEAVREDIARMVSGTPVAAKVREYAATSMNLTTRGEIFSAMVVYGFLSYEDGHVRIPNRELMEKFTDMLSKEPTLGYIYRLAKESEKMLQATLAGNTAVMAKILAFAHNTETPLLCYNDETDLTAVVNLVYLSARDFYRMEREDKAGTGYVDFIFYPRTEKKADAFILELKVDHTAEDAIRQIKDRKYALKFEGKLGERPEYTGRILGVGIAYDRETKVHTCKVEVLREALTVKEGETI